jgi:hypothetical protein
MPPLQALAALHGFWFMIVGLPVVWVLGHASPQWLRRIQRSLILVTLATGLLVLGHTLLVWLPEEPELRQAYVGQRFLFVIATLGSDLGLGRVPLVQLGLAGLVCGIGARRKQKTFRTLSQVPEANQSFGDSA